MAKRCHGIHNKGNAVEAKLVTFIQFFILDVAICDHYISFKVESKYDETIRTPPGSVSRISFAST